MKIFRDKKISCIRCFFFRCVAPRFYACLNLKSKNVLKIAADIEKCNDAKELVEVNR